MTFMPRSVFPSLFMVGLLLLCLAAGIPAASQPWYTAIDLGDGAGQAVSNTGQVLGGEPKYLPDLGLHVTVPWLWDSSTGRKELDFYASPTSINDGGDMTGQNWDGAWNMTAFVRHNGTIRTIPAFDGQSHAYPSGIDADGTVVGYSLAPSNGHARAFRYTLAGSLSEVGTLISGGSSYATSVRNGRIVGYAEAGQALPDGSYPVHAFRYDGAMHDLGTLGGQNSFATRVNAVGQVVGAADTGGHDTSGNVIAHAFLYSRGQMHDLGILDPTYFPASNATAINAKGAVIGQGYNPVGFGSRPQAFLWTPDVRNGTSGKMRTLNSLLPPDSGWGIAYARDINDSGQILCWAYDWLGGIHVLLLTPPNVVDHSRALTLQGVTADGKTYQADGIVCDNLACMRPAGKSHQSSTDAPDSPPGLRNCLKISLQGYSYAYNATLANSQGNTTDRDGCNNVGWVDTHNAGFLYYYPPDEFNERQHPCYPDENDLTYPATRTVYLTVTVKKTDGTVSQVNAQPIILARPPVVLVHGINSDPSAWTDSGDGISFEDAMQNSVQVPFAAVNHKDPRSYAGVDWTQAHMGLFDGLFGGNAPVEVGADLLSQLIKRTLAQVQHGEPVTDANQNHDYDTLSLSGKIEHHREINFDDTSYRSPDGALLRLSIRRVDAVAWSYGGVITRWYIASQKGTTYQSRIWYKRPGGYQLNVPGQRYVDFSLNLPDVAYGNDIRKVITLGSMWRGVPLVNYLNEALFGIGTGPALGDARLDGNVLIAPTLRYFASFIAPGQILPTQVPSMEVMAIDSRWIRQLIYNDQMKTLGPYRARPFDPTIAYGSVAGDNSDYITKYIRRLSDPNELLYVAQQPSWFPYLSLEHRGGSPRGYSDGLVPLWSSAIPGSYKIAPVNHSNYPRDPDTQNFVIQWLNRADLPDGTQLNTTWNDKDKVSVSTIDLVRTWKFDPIKTAPYPESDLYTLVGGVGRLTPDAWANLPKLDIRMHAVLSLSGNRINATLTFTDAGNVLVPALQIDDVFLTKDLRTGLSPTSFPYLLGTLQKGKTSNPVTLSFPAIATQGNAIFIHARLSTPLYPTFTFDGYVVIE